MSRVLILCAVVFLCGCGKSKVEEPEPPPLPKPDALVELLAKSRRELAGLEKECVEKVLLHHKERDKDLAGKHLQGGPNFPLIVPVWQEASFSDRAGFSLPPYARAGTKDNALAWHLARHGDLEAARRLAEPAEAEKLAVLHRGLYARNYPVEWTRLVARLIQLEEVRLRTGSEDAAAEIATLHGGLRKALDAAARKSPLGAVLLGLGRQSIADGRKTWDRGNNPERARQVERALSEWGDVPAPAIAVAPGMDRVLLEKLWGCSAPGKVLVAANATRALDASGLSLPAAGAEAVVACFDSEQKLRELVVTYKPGIGLRHPQPSDLVHNLLGPNPNPAKAEEKVEIRRSVYPLPGQSCEVFVCLRNDKFGGLVRFRADRAPEKGTALGRQFGAFHLDASFEHNRLLIAPRGLGEEVTGSDARLLARLILPLSGFRPREAVLGKKKDSSATQRLVLHGGREPVALHTLVGDFWGERGLGRIGAAEDSDGGHLAFAWDDSRTAYTLRIPNSEREPYEFETRNLGGKQSADSSTGFDRARRKERLEAGKPWAFLPRSLVLENVRLGRSRAQIEKAMPTAEKLPLGLRLVLRSKGQPGDPFKPRQLIVRFANDRAAEIRLLLLDPTDDKGRGFLSRVLEKYGATPAQPSSWATAWRDVSRSASSATVRQWRDDRTIMTYEQGAIAEWVLLDRPKETEDGIQLDALNLYPRGIEGCQLGTERKALLAGWKGTTAKNTEDDPLILFPATEGTFDAVLVWFKAGEVCRIVARHSSPKNALLAADQLGKAVEAAWGRVLGTVGWWTHREARGQQLTGLGWLDGRTRMRIFWQDDQGTPRVFSEWRETADLPGKETKGR